MASIVGNTLTRVAVAVAQELGPCQQLTTSSTPGAANLVVIASTLDSEAPAEKYGGYYLYNYADADPNSLLGQQGRITRSGFAGASGTFTVAAPFSVIPHSGAAWLLLGTIPVLDQDGLVGIRSCMNRAIRKLWDRQWIPFTAVAGQVEYDLGALWWASRDRFIRLMDPDPGGTSHPPVASQSWDVVQNADVWTLQLGSAYPVGETFWLVVDAPLNYRLYLGGAWANQAAPNAGLVLGEDACLGEWNHVFQATVYECMKALSVQAGGNRKAYWTGRAAEQRAVVAAIKAFQMDDDGESLGEGPSNGPAGGIGYGDRGLFTGGWGQY